MRRKTRVRTAPALLAPLPRVRGKHQNVWSALDTWEVTRLLADLTAASTTPALNKEVLWFDPARPAVRPLSSRQGVPIARGCRCGVDGRYAPAKASWSGPVPPVRGAAGRHGSGPGPAAAPCMKWK